MTDQCCLTFVKKQGNMKSVPMKSVRTGGRNMICKLGPTERYLYKESSELK